MSLVQTAALCSIVPVPLKAVRRGIVHPCIAHVVTVSHGEARWHGLRL